MRLPTTARARRRPLLLHWRAAMLLCPPSPWQPLTSEMSTCPGLAVCEGRERGTLLLRLACFLAVAGVCVPRYVRSDLESFVGCAAGGVVRVNGELSNTQPFCVGSCRIVAHPPSLRNTCLFRETATPSQLPKVSRSCLAHCLPQTSTPSKTQKEKKTQTQNKLPTNTQGRGGAGRRGEEEGGRKRGRVCSYCVGVISSMVCRTAHGGQCYVPGRAALHGVGASSGCCAARAGRPTWCRRRRQ